MCEQNRKLELVNRIRCSVARQLLKEKNLEICGFGSKMEDKNEILSLLFNYNKDIEIEEAREFLMCASNLFLQKLNNEAVQPYFTNYPFTINDIGIYIFLNRPDGGGREAEEFSFASLRKGILMYNNGIDQPMDPNNSTETFAEAEEILKHKKDSQLIGIR